MHVPVNVVQQSIDKLGVNQHSAITALSCTKQYVVTACELASGLLSCKLESTSYSVGLHAQYSAGEVLYSITRTSHHIGV